MNKPYVGRTQQSLPSIWPRICRQNENNNFGVIATCRYNMFLLHPIDFDLFAHIAFAPIRCAQTQY